MASEQDCLDALHEAAATLGHSPSKAEYEELGLRPASATIIRTLGGWNDAKARADLSTNASTGSRVGPPPDDVDSEIRDQWSVLSVDQRWHYRHQAWNTERTRQRRSERREWVAARKAATGCARCGETDPVVLDYHHRSDEEKDKKVSQLVIEESSKDRIREEIAKCDVLCANCHRAEHVSQETGALQLQLRENPVRVIGKRPDGEPFEVVTPELRRRWVNRYKEDRGCAICDCDKGVMLDLHHRTKHRKELTVSRLVSEGYGTERVYQEIQRCQVLCANCHRRRHHTE